jgi:S-ribosylhomocysteine lyase LuxS involved in autoinducer biosynthesis
MFGRAAMLPQPVPKADYELRFNILSHMQVRAFAYAYADKVVAEPLGAVKRVMIPPSPFGTRTATRLQMAIELRYIDVGEVPATLLQNVAEVDGCTNVAHCGRITVSV